MDSILLYQVGTVAITTNSLPALVAVPLFVAVGFWLSVKNRVLGWLDVVLVLASGLLQVMLMPLITGAGTTQLGVFLLSWPIVGFMCGYGAWRIAGHRPLQNWPWYRFGLLTTLLLLIVDIAGAFVLSPPPGRIWQLGGAGFLDALVLGPPVLTLAFYGFLDCRSSLVFCSKGCRGANQCLHGMVSPKAANTTPTYTLLKRIAISTVLATIVFFVHTGLSQDDIKAKHLLPVSVAMDLNRFIEDVSTKYQIEPPALIQVGEKAVAFTRKSLDGAHVDIYLGEAFATNTKLAENPEIAHAVVAHEIGHAVLLARQQGFPNFLLVAAYVFTLAALLCSMPTRSGTIIASIAMLVGLSVATTYFHVATHAAIKDLVLKSAIVGIFAAFFWKRSTQLPGIMETHLPTRSSFLTASIIAAMLFFFGMPAIGALNTSRELFADRVAACEAGNTQIAAALNLLHPKTAHPLVEGFLDPFHPASHLRLNALSSMSSQEMPALCQHLRETL